MADLIISSLRGGMNNTDPPTSIPEDQCILAENVEFFDSMLGERRKGTTAITLPADITNRDRVTFLHTHVPASDLTDAELWVLGVTGTTTAKLCRKTDSWSTITIPDTPDLTGFTQYQWAAVSIHGKIHFAYASGVDRLHVWDGTSLRRSGLDAPGAAPTAADSGGAGDMAGDRFYRVRYAVISGSTTLIKGEPSDTLTFSPSGANESITITKPASISEDETHWILEASTDNANFYVLATTVVGTTTVVDTTAYGTGYTAFDLSEDVGDYTLIGSARYLTHDDDRLIWGGSWEDSSLDSRVGWTPVFGAEGDGNDERMEADTDPFRDLDANRFGALTGLTEPVLGGIWAFKQHAIYKLTKTGTRSAAYDSDKFTDALGAIHGSVVSGIDSQGQPCIYFLDHEQGPCRIGLGGIKRCGEDLRKTWERLNVNAASVATSSLYYPAKKQVYWNIAVDEGDAPTIRVVLHTDKSRDFADGVRKGWALWTGNIAKALTMTLFSDNIEDDTTRSLRQVPFIGLEGLGLVHICDTGYEDNDVAYTATITTKPYWMKTLLASFTVHSAMLVAKAMAAATITIKCLRDFAVETTSTVEDIPLDPVGSETHVIKDIDNLSGAELIVAQFQFTDGASPTAQWHLDRMDVREEVGQKK